MALVGISDHLVGLPEGGSHFAGRVFPNRRNG